MNTILKLFLTFFIFKSISNLCIAQTTTKTVESIGNIKRREMILDENLEVIREDYFSNNHQQLIVSIEYSKPNIISSITGFSNYPTIAYKVDFKNGTYFDAEEGVELKFKDNFIFNGEQKGKNIIVNYIDNKKEGKLVQADSVVIGKKLVVYDKVDTRYLKYDIVKFSQELGEESVYKMYKGLLLSFKNNKLNGKQKSYYGDASVKFDGYFIDNKLIDYTSFSKTGSTISKLKSVNGVSLTPQLLNGNILNRDFSYVYWHPDLIQAGDIYFDSNLDSGEGSNYRSNVRFLYDTEKYGGRDIRKYMGIKEIQREKPYTLQFKQKFDADKNTFSNPYVIKHLLNIPDFCIRKYEFTEEEDRSIVAIKVENSDIDTINTFKNISLSFADGFYYNLSKQNYYLFGQNYQSKLFLMPNNSPADKYFGNGELEKLSSLNNALGKWLLNTFNIESIFYLCPKIASDGDEMRYAIPKYAYDSASINAFLNVFVEKMLSNIGEIKKGNPSNINYSFIKNPFVGVSAGYSFEKNNESHFRYFNFQTLGNSSIIIKNRDDVRYFKIYDKYRTEYFDGNCVYSFLFKEGGWGVFNVEKVDVKCNQ